MKLQGKVLVVTGGGAGIGRATVLELLSRGAEVAAVDISEAGLKETADLADAGDRLSLHPLDITDRDQVLALPKAVTDQHGQVDGLVNIAGIIQVGAAGGLGILREPGTPDGRALLRIAYAPMAKPEPPRVQLDTRMGCVEAAIVRRTSGT